MTGGDRHDARRGRTRPRLGEKSALSEEVREPAPQTAEGVPTGGKTASQEPGSSGKGGCVKMPRDGRGTAPGVARRSALRGRCGVARRMGEQWLKASGNREDETATARQGCMGSCCFRGCSLSHRTGQGRDRLQKSGTREALPVTAVHSRGHRRAKASDRPGRQRS